MMSRAIGVLIATLAATLTTIPDASAQRYLGVGASSLSLSSQYSAIDGGSGTGLTLLFGVKLDTWFGELAVGGTGIDVGETENIYYPADSAGYGILRFSIGKSLWPVEERGWTPWAALGWAYHGISWDTYAYMVDGAGASLGAGADFALPGPLRARLQAIWHRFDARDAYNHGPYSSRSRELSAVVMMEFR